MLSKENMSLVYCFSFSPLTIIKLSDFSEAVLVTLFPGIQLSVSWLLNNSTCITRAVGMSQEYKGNIILSLLSFKKL